tara:strand:- start:47 stop:265 length:219 start_codon:yes stop_codon:yes gene_type:complete
MVIFALVDIAVTMALVDKLVPLTFMPIRMLLVSLIGKVTLPDVAVVVDLVTVVVGLLNATTVEVVIHPPPQT